MDFEKAYQKFLNGTASPEETEFVRSEMKKASEINDILDTVKNDGATKTAEDDIVKKAIKAFWKKDTLKILLIVCSAILVLAIGVSCAIGIPILTSAGDNLIYSREEAKTIAIEHVSGKYPDSTDEIRVIKIERELEIEGRIKNARYIYTVDIYNGNGNVLEIEIDSKTGKILEIDR